MAFRRSICGFGAEHAAKHAAAPFIPPFKMNLLQTPGGIPGGAESLA